jgi:hypothetical protein
MTFHHSNRVIFHLNPIRGTKTKPDSRGRFRHIKITGNAQAVLLHLASALNIETGSFPVSIETIYSRTDISKGTIQASLEQLVSYGVISRERRSARKAFTYRLLLECPLDCVNLKDHNTPKELAERPSSRDTHTPETFETPEKTPSSQEAERPTNQDDSVLTNRSLIDRDKQVNKKKLGKSACFECKGIAEEVSGDLQLIHRRGTCKQLIRTMSSDTWAYAVDNYPGNWDALSRRSTKRVAPRSRFRRGETSGKDPSGSRR